jgi:hypothetical protein
LEASISHHAAVKVEEQLIVGMGRIDQALKIRELRIDGAEGRAGLLKVGE